MAFGIGFVAAFVAIWRRGGQTRLKTLKKRLKEKSPSKTRLYQYPVKKLLSLVFICALAWSLQWFSAEVELDLRSKITKSHLFPSTVTSNHSNTFQLFPTSNQTQPLKPTDKPNLYQRQIEAQRQMHQDLSRMRSVLKCIHIFLLLVGASLLSSLDLRIVTAKRGDNSIKMTTYSWLGLKRQQSQYKVKNGDKLTVWQMGQNRITNTNYYYAVKIVNQDGSLNLINKGCMFDARTAVIKLADQLDIPFSTKVNKGLAKENAKEQNEM